LDDQAALDREAAVVLAPPVTATAAVAVTSAAISHLPPRPQLPALAVVEESKSKAAGMNRIPSVSLRGRRGRRRPRGAGTERRSRRRLSVSNSMPLGGAAPSSASPPSPLHRLRRRPARVGRRRRALGHPRRRRLAAARGARLQAHALIEQGQKGLTTCRVSLTAGDEG
jgi:hypothetical protein